MFRFQNVTKQFSSKYVLQDFSFEISCGDKIVVTGRSGIGKTTLFRLLLGFEKPDSGLLLFENQPYTDLLTWEVRKKVAYVSQDLSIGAGKVEALFTDTLLLKSNLNCGGSLDNALELMEIFELPATTLQSDIEKLSGGEKQRVAIINALLLQRKVFLLDEVSSALDVTLKKRVLDYFFVNPNFTVLSITHDSYLPAGVDVKFLKLD